MTSTSEISGDALGASPSVTSASNGISAGNGFDAAVDAAAAADAVAAPLCVVTSGLLLLLPPTRESKTPHLLFVMPGRV